jgi:large subunit ribosomal protein L4
MRSALSAKLAEEVLYVVDGFSFEKPSTRQAAEIVKSLDIKGRVTVVVGEDDMNAMLSFRNLPQVRVITASESNTYDLVDNAAVLFTKPALTWLEGVLS